MKAAVQYFPVVLFIMPYKVVLAFESVDEMLKYDHSNESYWAVLSCGAVYYAVRSGCFLLYMYAQEIKTYCTTWLLYLPVFYKPVIKAILCSPITHSQYPVI